jgi:ribosomal protein S18 acetylase RimI-like enzyme
LEYNRIPAGTIRETISINNEIELYYHVSPLFRNRGIGQQMMRLYLSERQGYFVCKVKTHNVSSIKLIKKFGFKLVKAKNGIGHFYLNKRH